jgi:hypothetical protein
MEYLMMETDKFVKPLGKMLAERLEHVVDGHLPSEMMTLLADMRENELSDRAEAADASSPRLLATDDALGG